MGGFQAGGPTGQGLVARPASDGGPIAPSGIELCSCYDSTIIEAVSKVFQAAGGQRGGVLTERVRDGFYWWIPLVNGITDDGNGQAFDLYLVDPLFYPIPIPLGANPVTPNGCYKICAASGISNDGGLSFSSQGGRATAFPNQSSVILVPSRWALLLAEANTIIPGAGRNLTLRYLKAEIKNGCQPPF